MNGFDFDHHHESRYTFNLHSDIKIHNLVFTSPYQLSQLVFVFCSAFAYLLVEGKTRLRAFSWFVQARFVVEYVTSKNQMLWTVYTCPAGLKFYT